MKDSKPLVTFMFGLTVGMSIGALMMMWSATNMQRNQAIKAGVGEYKIDRETGETWFQYGVIKEAK